MHKILHTKHKRNIAYRHNKGNSSIGLIFFSGFKSDMQGSKAQFIFNWCLENNVECTIFDYSGHGKSSEKFIDCNISTWVEDGIDIIKKITLNPQIIIGSSMGAWIGIRVALKMKKKIKGLITIAAAPDFTKSLWEDVLNKNQKTEILTKGHIFIPSDYDNEGYIISKNLIENGNKNLILNTSLLKLNLPIKLLHGEKDKDVNWQRSLEIFNRLKNINAELILIKNGDHRLSNAYNLKSILKNIKSLISDLLH